MLQKIIHATSLKANIIANFAGNGWSALISFIFVPIYLKYIGPEGYGLLGIFSSLQIVLSILDSGLSTTLNKEIARLSVLNNTAAQMRNIVKTLGSIYWIVAAIACLIAIALSPLLAHYWVKPKELSVETITYCFILLSLSLAFQFPVGFYSGGLLGLQRQVMLNVLRIVFATIKNVGAFLLLFFVSKSVLLFFLWTFLISLIQALTVKYFVWRYLPASESKAVFDKKEIKDLWKFASGLMGISLTAVLLTQADKLILSKILTLDQFGYYTIACTLGLLIYQFVTPLSQSYFPKFATLLSVNDIDNLKKKYHQACQLISILVLPATCILVFFSKDLIFLWTHDKVATDHTWLVTSIYAFGTGVNGLMNLPYILTITYNWTSLTLYQNIFFLLLIIPLTIFLATIYGAAGGAASWAIINILYFLIMPHLIHKKIFIGEKGIWYWNDNIKILLGTLSIIFLGRVLLDNFAILNVTLRLFFIALIGMAGIVAGVLLSNEFNGRFLRSKKF